MSHFYARAVFFCTDADESLRYYTEKLGFHLDWATDDAGRTFVFQVSLFGFEVILNQGWQETLPRIGKGRVFIGLDDDQGEPLRQHIQKYGIQTKRIEWGRRTLLIQDPDGNELFFWIPHDDFTGFNVTVDEAIEDPPRIKLRDLSSPPVKPGS